MDWIGWRRRSESNRPASRDAGCNRAATPVTHATPCMHACGGRAVRTPKGSLLGRFRNGCRRPAFGLALQVRCGPERRFGMPPPPPPGEPQSPLSALPDFHRCAPTRARPAPDPIRWVVRAPRPPCRVVGLPRWPRGSSRCSRSGGGFQPPTTPPGERWRRSVLGLSTACVVVAYEAYPRSCRLRAVRPA
jgi:hypothetical protein